MSHRHAGPTRKVSFNANVAQVVVKILRDIATFALGAYAFIHELTRSGSERPQILIMSAALMGLPLVMRGDEKRQEAKHNDDERKT